MHSQALTTNKYDLLRFIVFAELWKYQDQDKMNPE